MDRFRYDEIGEEPPIGDHDEIYNCNDKAGKA
jgi:hypothetical protein